MSSLFRVVSQPQPQPQDAGDEEAEPKTEPHLELRESPTTEPALLSDAPEQTASSIEALRNPLARDSMEEAAQLEAALKLSANDTSAQPADLGLKCLNPSTRRGGNRIDVEWHEEPEPASATPRSILKHRKHEMPPACLEGRELDGEAGRRALSERIQAVLRSSHGNDPTPEEISALQIQFSISAEDVMTVFRYFRELMGTFQKNIRETIGL